MTWWQTLLVTIVSVTMTTIALFGQQWLIGRRGARERLEDKLERQVAELTDAHAEMLGAIVALGRPLSTMGDAVLIEWVTINRMHYPEDELAAIDFARADAALGRLMIIESFEVSRAAKYAVEMVAGLRTDLLAANARLSTITAGEHVTNISAGFGGALKEYADLASDSVARARGQVIHAVPPTSTRR